MEDAKGEEKRGILEKDKEKDAKKRTMKVKNNSSSLFAVSLQAVDDHCFPHLPIPCSS